MYRHLIVLFLSLLLISGCKDNFSGNTAGHNPMAAQGPETWDAGGKKITILKSYYLALPEGLQYTVESPYDFGSNALKMTEQQALDIAFPLMRHAYEKGLYNRTKISEVGHGPLEVKRIGVVLVQGEGMQARGYRIGLSLDQIRAKLITPQN